MANEKNLIPQSKRTKSEQRVIAACGGKASGAARRKRKAMRQVLGELLRLPAESDEAREALRGLMDLEDADNQAAMLAGLLKTAMLGNVKAVQEVRNIMGENRDTAAEKAERKARTEKLQADVAASKAKARAEGPDAPENNLFQRLEEGLYGLFEAEQTADGDHALVDNAGRK